jgi:hypothetical protein
MPRDDGGRVTIRVDRKVDSICCTIDDDGIGRKLSDQNKFSGEFSKHSPQGLKLTQSRLHLDNELRERSGSVEIIDKTDSFGKPNGTSIILTFKED